VFEIGSGIGCNLKHFELAGFDVAGIEPGEGFRKFAREKLHLQVEGCVLAELPRKPRYDLVLLVHVLEHFNSPTTALQHIRSTLNPGGRLYVEVPNLGAPHAAPGKLFHYAHIYNFTPRTLSAAAGATGFVVDEVLSDPQEKNLAMLLSAVNCYKLEVSPDAYRNTVEAISRFNTVTYHVRWEYLRERLLGVRDLLTGKFGAQKQVAKILEAPDRCETSSSREGVTSLAQSSTEGADLDESPGTSRRSAA
jgi:SAM-dependent methyltransferase